MVRAEFGLFTELESGDLEFVSSSVVPRVTSQTYGWIIRLITDKPFVRWREEFILPEKPETWGEPELLGKRTISDDGRVSVTEREVAPEHGVIFNRWSVAPGDPAGRYVILVFVEGVGSKEFEFEVQ